TVKTAVLQGKRGRNRPVDPSSTEPPRARARGGGVELLGQLGKIGPKSPANAGFLQLTQAWVNWELLWGDWRGSRADRCDDLGGVQVSRISSAIPPSSAGAQASAWACARSRSAAVIAGAQIDTSIPPAGPRAPPARTEGCPWT